LSQQGIIPLIPVEDVRYAAYQFGYDSEIAYNHDPSWPFPITQVIKAPPKIEKFGSMVYIPFNLCEQAQENPIATLAKLAGLASQLSDYGNGRYRYQGNIILRGMATYAQVLGKASRLYPDFALTPSQERLIAQFPYGITSLSPHEQEPDINGNQIPNYWKN